MAVQAQHPSNALFLERSVQEGKNPPIDYSLQPQPGGGGGFVDQSHHQMMILRNGVGSNPRKRGRESSVYNPFRIQQSQLIDVLTGLRLASGEQLQQQQQQNLSRQAFSSPQSSLLLSVLSEDFAAPIRQQRDEIQQFLQAQGEELRRTLAEKRQRHYRELLGAAEVSAARRLREKDAELEKAVRRNAELEALAAQLSAEGQAWQTRARAQEAAAAALQAQLQQAVMSGAGGKQAVELGGGEAEDAESAYIDPERVEAMGSGPCCKGCRKRAATVVVLPCRHLCLCTECGVVAQACPLCLTVRQWMLEVVIS